MHVQSFDSTEAMVEHLRQNREAAHNLMHEAQRTITWGDHWVQFVPGSSAEDLLTVWGKVDTREQIARAEIDTGAMSWEEVVTVIADTEAQQADGLLYGKAYDRHNPIGELGYTHKAHVWPIEKRLFDAARDVRFHHLRFTDPAMRLLLEIAYRSFRAHIRSLS